MDQTKVPHIWFPTFNNPTHFFLCMWKFSGLISGSVNRDLCWQCLRTNCEPWDQIHVSCLHLISCIISITQHTVLNYILFTNKLLRILDKPQHFFSDAPQRVASWSFVIVWKVTFIRKVINSHPTNSIL